MSVWHPKEGDLSRYMHGLMEAAYQQRERPKCSRDDFADGWMACLKALRSTSAFKPGVWQEDEEAPR